MTVGTRRVPLARKRTTARSWACAFCPSRNVAGAKKCSVCGIKRGTGRETLDGRAMDQWAKHVKRGGRCARCGLSDALALFGRRLEAAHVVRRARSRNTRWHPLGGIPLCGPSMPGTCHYWYDEQASDEERAAFTISIIGRATYDELHRIKNEAWDRDYVKVFAALKKAKEAA